MAKVSDPDYLLPVIRPSEIVGEMTSGANNPIHIRGFDSITHQKEEYVVKLKDSERMSDPGAAMREMLAAFIALEMDIPVAEPVLVQIAPEVADLTDKPYLKQRIRNSIGANFGTRYLGFGYQVFPLLASFPPKLERQAQELVAFDLLIQNPDRTKKKPNMLTNGTHLVGFDHELAFSFDKVLFAPVNLWQQTGDLRQWINNLVLMPHIKGSKFEYDDFSDRIGRLNEHFWNRIETVMPAEWNEASYTRIKSVMNDFVQQRHLFINELKLILS